MYNKKVIKVIKTKISKANPENIEPGKESARGLTSFSSEEINKIKGLKSDQIEKILGYSSKSEIVHRDDMVKL